MEVVDEGRAERQRLVAEGFDKLSRWQVTEVSSRGMTPLIGLELFGISWSWVLHSASSWRTGCRFKMAKPCSDALYCFWYSGYFRCELDGRFPYKQVAAWAAHIHEI
ncbi:MAG: hypothetical protein LZF86_200009 [Nitrospira sp.]|nr:MAG: hypothetical protein LZF86_200009 [Nitrospira sp.]